MLPGTQEGNCKVVRSSGFSWLPAHNFRLKAGLRTAGGRLCCLLTTPPVAVSRRLFFYHPHTSYIDILFPESLWNVSGIAATLWQCAYPSAPQSLRRCVVSSPLAQQQGGSYVELALSVHPCQRLPSGTAADGRGRGARPSAGSVPRSALHGGAAGFRRGAGRGCQVRGACRAASLCRRIPGRAARCCWPSSLPGLPSGKSASTGRARRSIRRRRGRRPFELPQNVHSFPAARSRAVVQRRRGAAGAAGGHQLRRAAALAAGRFPGRRRRAVHGRRRPRRGRSAAVLQTRAIHYWALGGRHDRSTPQAARRWSTIAAPAGPAARGKRRPRLHARPSRRATSGPHQPDSDRRGPVDERAIVGRRSDDARVLGSPASGAGQRAARSRCRPRRC